MIFMQEVVLNTIGVLECQCDCTQMQTFVIVRTCKHMLARLNERKSALAFATWAVFGFEHVRTLRVRSKTFRT